MRPRASVHADCRNSSSRVGERVESDARSGCGVDSVMAYGRVGCSDIGVPSVVLVRDIGALPCRYNPARTVTVVLGCHPAGWKRDGWAAPTPPLAD